MFAAFSWRAPARGLAFLTVAAFSSLAIGAEPETPALDLRTVLTRTLERSPVLNVFPYRERAADGHILQAGLRPNPELSVELENAVGTGPFSGLGGAEVTLALSQVVELGGKRERRSTLAGLNRDLVGADYEIARLEVLADTAARFIHVAADAALLDLSVRYRQLTDRALAAVTQRVDAGRTPSAERSQARIAVVRASITEEHAEHEFASARVRLAASWGEMEPRFGAVQADLFEFPDVPEFDALVSRLDETPGLERYLTVERVRAAELRLAEANGRQNARIGLGVRRLEATGDQALTLSFSMPLPLSDRNQGNAAAARADYARLDAERERTRIEIYSALFGLYQELLHARMEATVLQNEMLPEAQHALEQVEAGYRAGRFSYLELVEAGRQRLDVERAAIEAAAKFHTLLLELERLTGEPLVITPAAGDTQGE